MIFNISIVNLINTLIIAAGIGICGLCFMQITASIHIRKDVRRYFQIFFALIILYISMHLARQIMDGIMGNGVRTALYIVTFIEILTAGFMAHMLSLLVLAVSKQQTNLKPLAITLYAIIIVHLVILVVSCPLDLIYYFDEANVYHRASLYLFSNLCPIAMLVIDMVLLVRYRKNIDRNVLSAFWFYMLAPLVAAIVQSITYGVQFIIFATIVAAVYMFSVIILRQNKRYEEQQKEAQRLDTELSLATRIQTNMLPNIFPAFPERKEFDIYASMKPAKEVGGDFYDFFFVDDNHLALVIADVSGKGIPAALFMMISKILVQNYTMISKNAKLALEATNAQICKNNREDMFVTVWLGILDLDTGVLTAANAGHEFPIIKPADGSFDILKDKHGFVIGGMEMAKYKEYEIKLEKGAKLFLYTDGLSEATNANKELFGIERIVETVRTAENDSPKAILEIVDKAVNDFVQDAPQFDDLTMLCLEYKG